MALILLVTRMVSGGGPRLQYPPEWYVLGVKLSLGHAGFNPNRPTSLPAHFTCRSPPPPLPLPVRTGNWVIRTRPIALSDG